MVARRGTDRARALVDHLRSDSLFRNSFYLVLTGGVTAALGFCFWWLCARLFTDAQVGVGTALISGMSLISYLGLLGMNTAFVRFLPTSQDRDGDLDAGLLLVTGTSAVLAIGYLLCLPWFAPKLDFVRTNPWYAVGFVVLGSLAAINYLTDSVFTAYRANQWNLVINGTMSLTKMLLPLGLVALGGYGLFVASGAAAFLALVMSLAIMVLKFGYRPRFLVTMPAVRRMFAFAGANYIANCLNVLPTMVLPIIVFNRLGEAASGYYYLSFMIANLLYTVAYSVTQSLFAEGSYLEQSLSSLVRRAVLILAVVMVPASIVLALVPRRLLLLFGGGYSANAATTLAVLALAAPGVAIYSMAVVLLRIQDHIVAIVAMNVVYCLAILGLAQAWCRRGLVWVAVAWLVGQLVAGVLGLVLAWRRRLSTAQPSATARNAERAVS